MIRDFETLYHHTTLILQISLALSTTYRNTSFCRQKPAEVRGFCRCSILQNLAQTAASWDEGGLIRTVTEKPEEHIIIQEKKSLETAMY